MKIYIKRNTAYERPIQYVLNLIANNQKLDLTYIESKEHADLVFDHLADNSEPISEEFYAELAKQKPCLSHTNFFRKEPVIKTNTGTSDFVATIFYMTNCLQEHNAKDDMLDRYGRFKYESSYQYKFNCIEDNLVQQHIDHLVSSWGLELEQKRSSIFISHDIDEMYASLLQDGYWAVKNLKPIALLRILFNELIRRPHWKNMDRMMRINSEYDVRSTFFWLVNSGQGSLGINNADYTISKERGLLNSVEENGFINGLHKSASDMSIDQELEKGELNSTYNRYHFLKFLPSNDWPKISDSKLDFDCSLGFAERFGFRNSYGKSFQPYSLDRMQTYDFVETPLVFMDRTLQAYMKLNKDDIATTIIDFIELNKDNCHISILWHNKFFTDYKFNGFLKEYKQVLAYIYDNGFKSVTPSDIIQEIRG